MLTLQQKRLVRRVATSRVLQVALFVVVVGLASAVYGRYEIAREMSDRRERSEVERSKIEQRKAVLEERVRYITSERGIEAEMRRQFDIARDGEQVIVIIDESDQ